MEMNFRLLFHTINQPGYLQTFFFKVIIPLQQHRLFLDFPLLFLVYRVTWKKEKNQQ